MKHYSEGLGKSHIVRKYAKENNLDVIELGLDGKVTIIRNRDRTLMKTIILSVLIVLFMTFITASLVPSKATYLDVSRTILREIK